MNNVENKENSNAVNTGANNTEFIDWSLLAESPEGSDLFSDNDVAVATKQAITNIEENIEQLRNILVASSKQKAGEFYELQKLGRESNKELSKGFFGTRARRSKNSIMLVWFQNMIMQTKSGKRVFSKEIPRGRSLRYTKTTFRRAADWEQDIIDYVEDAYAKIREQWSHVTKIATSLRSLERTITEHQSSVETPSSGNDDTGLGNDLSPANDKTTSNDLNVNSEVGHGAIHK